MTCVPVVADRAYQGAGPWVTGSNVHPAKLTSTQRTINRALAQARMRLDVLAVPEDLVQHHEPWQMQVGRVEGLTGGLPARWGCPRR